MNISIEKATQKDFDQLVNLFYELNFKFNTDITTGQTRELLQVKNENQFSEESTQWIIDDCICFVARMGEELIGYISGKIKTNEGEVFTPEAEILTWFVTESKRGNGIGQLLYTAFLEYVKDQGCKVLTAEAYAENTETIQTYKRMGFEDDSVILKKKL